MAEVLFARGNRHTIGEEIRRFRLNDMMRRLRDTDETIATICVTCGFFSPSHAKRAFKSHFKCTMSEVRKMRPVAVVGHSTPLRDIERPTTHCCKVDLL